MRIRFIIFGVILIIIALVLLSIIVAFLNPPVEDTETIEGGGSYSAHLSLMGDDIIEGDFKIKQGTVNFFICDEKNHKEYRESKSYEGIETHELMEGVSNGSYKFTIPEEGAWYETEKWYVVFDCSDSSAGKTVIESNIEHKPYRTLQYYVKIILIVIGAIGILRGIMPRKRRKWREERASKEPEKPKEKIKPEEPKEKAKPEEPKEITKPDKPEELPL